MNKRRLHEEFVKELYKKIPRKTALVNEISDILQIEKEPASRRLNEKVQFSINEMGILAKKFGISLDSLLYEDKHCHWVPLLLESPLGVESIDVLYDIMDASLDELIEDSQDVIEYGSLFNSLPVEYFVHHPYLMKFMLFKWGHYFVGTEEFNDFSKWAVPGRLSGLKDKAESILVNSEHTIYIWDESLIWTLVNEIEYFYKMDILSTQDLENIKKDLKESLVNLEKYLSGITKPEKSSKKLSFYVSNTNLGMSAYYLFSEKKKAYSFKTNFTFMSSSDNNYNNYDKVKDWINSFKHISVLISGSGPLDRRLFFLKQHKIIDNFLTIKEDPEVQPIDQ